MTKHVARLGARVVSTGAAEFRVWAPLRDRVELDIEGGTHLLTREDDGFFSTQLPFGPGARYWYRLDGVGPFADPCSRCQPEGVLGPSQLIDVARATPTWNRPALDELVLYEIHVGTFSDPGTFLGVIDRLAVLRALGVRAIELMPLGTFPGSRGWGYDGLYTWAPQWSYGVPSDLVRLIDAAHEADLGVIVDVVYNHIGPGNEKLAAFGPYFSDAASTLWGQTIDYSQRGVREWAIQNAEMWIGEYGVDGLRIDAAHAVYDNTTPHVLAELASRVREYNRSALVISEMQIGDLRPIEEWGHDAQWADDLHHALHALLTGERDGYYAEYGTVADVARALEQPHRDKFVVCAQNHDQIGNRAYGDRLRGSKLRLAAATVAVSQSIPLLFMGEEYDESHPFQFFTDHIDPAIAQAMREGRRKEFARFTSFGAEDIPDPQDVETFLRSKLDVSDGDPATTAFYRELFDLRSKLRAEPLATIVDEKRRYLRVLRGETEIAMNFSNDETDGVAPMSVAVRR